MQSSKLFTLLRGITPSELHWLYKFLKSPFHNSNEQVLALFLYTKKHYPQLDSPKLSKEAIHDALFPKQKFSPQRIRKLMHKLSVSIEDFMVARHLQKNQQERKKILTQAFGQRNLHGLFEKSSKEIMIDLEKVPYRNTNFYLEKYQVYYNFLMHPMTVKQGDISNKLLVISEQLDRFYFLQKLQLNCGLETIKAIYVTENQLPFFNEIKLIRHNITRPRILCIQICNEISVNFKYSHYFQHQLKHFVWI